ncbi:hypothetical protein FZEAL_1355 [Fusarium zealandicum]|uniref:Uncharacterized protein n=1 Tax=Fusarium zealandicum TaxID=1053134 RepID=A0A8H4UTF3_9HYPO|nr:hypothetical protein FZEAL_1355 [Fusarium zealandicum]
MNRRVHWKSNAGITRLLIGPRPTPAECQVRPGLQQLDMTDVPVPALAGIFQGEKCMEEYLKLPPKLPEPGLALSVKSTAHPSSPNWHWPLRVLTSQLPLILVSPIP